MRRDMHVAFLGCDPVVISYRAHTCADPIYLVAAEGRVVTSARVLSLTKPTYCPFHLLKKGMYGAGR